MRLERLVIDGFGTNRHLHLDSFNSGLNLIFGDRSTGKSTIRRSIKHTIFGNQFRAHTDSSEVCGTTLDVAAHGHHFRLTPRHNTEYVAGSGSPICQIANLDGQRERLPTGSELFGGIDWELYRTFFDLEFRERQIDSRELSRVLLTRLDVPAGHSRWADDHAWQQWRREADARATEYDAVVGQLDRLRAEQDQLTSQIRESRERDEDRLAQIRLQIQTFTDQLDSLRAEQNSLITRKDALMREIADLRSRIDHLLSEVQYVPVQQPGVDRLALIYERLDEIDNQLNRWRTVQGDIQHERIKLRDEMNAWEDVSIDSSDHPYHTTREIVQSLEHKIQKTEQHAQQFRSDPAGRTDGGHSHQIVELCLSMRDDLYALCQELGVQYKHVRHRAAKGELKQLRKCYKELGENEQRLAKRRDELLAELRQLDPAGFDAIQHDPRFCQCAEHEGYLAARRQFVGPTHREVEYRTVQHDVSFERQRLAELEDNLAHCQNRITAIGDQILSDDEKLRELTAEHRHVEQLEHIAELQSRLADIQSDLRTAQDREQVLARQVAEDRAAADTRPSELLVAASALLEEFTGGEFDSIWIDSNADQLCAGDRAGRQHRFGELSRGRQDQVFLATALAAADELRQRGIEIPVVIDDPFVNIEHADTALTLESINRFCRHELQALVLTSHRQVWERAQEIGAARHEHHVTWQHPAAEVAPPIRTERHVRTTPPVERWTAPVRTASQLFQTPETRYARPLAAPPAFTPRTPRSKPVARQELAAPETTNDVTENSPLGRWPTINEQELNLFRLLGVTTAGELLDLEPEKTLDRRFLELGVDPQSVSAWQSEVLLALCVPELSFAEAHYLVQFGITEPEQLEESQMATVIEKMNRQHGSDIDFRARLDKWRGSWRRNRSWWVGRSRYRRTQQRRSQDQRSPRRETTRFADIRSGYPAEIREDLDARTDFARPSTDYERSSSRTGSERNWSAHQRAASRKRASLRDSIDNDEGHGVGRTVSSNQTRLSADRPVARENGQNGSSKSSSTSSTGKYKFYLDLGDNIDAAPSIGAKTAERFAKIGVVSVDDFLNSSAESMAEKIAYKRINSGVIRQWQQQTHLVCRVPNLRGHDAQLLVACGITEPDELASMDPHRLYGIIKPFADSKDGAKIIRSAKKPDLAEITDWIEWANHNRALKAA